MSQITVAVPDIGDFSGVEVIEVNVAVGDTIAVDDTILTLESDKASLDIPSSAAGTVKEIKVNVGDKVSQGDVVLMLEASAEAAAEPPAEEVAPAPSESKKDAVPAPTPAAAKATPEPADAGSGQAHASPLVRRLAREFGVDLNQVRGTGRKGRIQREDMLQHIKQAMSGSGASGGLAGIAPAPVVDFTKFGEVEEQPLSRINKLSAQGLHRNWVSIPHVTQFDEVNISEMEAFRKAHKARAESEGVKLTPLVFLMKAVVKALQKFPRFNSSLSASGESIVLKKYFHIGVAVDTPNGLVVPVIRNVEQKSLLSLAKELAEMSAKAREGKLSPSDMQGSCFTISSLGGIGGTAFTPIINAPDVAILGVSKAQMKQVYLDGEFVAQLMLPLSLSYDHRVIDGADAARFITYFGSLLADIRRILL